MLISPPAVRTAWNPFRDQSTLNASHGKLLVLKRFLNSGHIPRHRRAGKTMTAANSISSQALFGSQRISQPNATDSTNSAQRTASLLGQTLVVVDTANSALQNASEEIAMHHSDRAEKSMKEKNQKSLENQADFMELAEINDYLRHVNNTDQNEALQNFAQLISSQKPAPNAGDLLGEARGKFPDDPMQQYLALQWAGALMTEQKASEEELKEVRDALSELENQHEIIRCNLNTSSVAAEAGEGLSGAEAKKSIKEFQNDYKEFLHGERELVKTLNRAIELFGSENLERSFDLFQKALAADFQATRPSHKEKIGVAMGDLATITTVVTTLDQCKTISAKHAQKYPDTPGPGAELLLKEVLTILSEKFVQSARFIALAENNAPSKEIAARIQFLLATRKMICDLNDRAFTDSNHRKMLNESLIAAQDRVTSDEDNLQQS